MNDFERFKKEHQEKKEKKLKKAKQVVAGTLAAAIISSGMAIGALVLDQKEDKTQKKNIKEDYVSVDTQNIAQKKDKKITLPNNSKQYNANDIALKSFGGTSYYTMSEDYVLNIAKQSMERVENVLKTNVPNITPLAAGDTNFFPQYYDEHMLAGLSFTESSYRICTTDGTPLTSKEGALGPMQILPETVNYVNYWLKSVMEIDGIEFTEKDLTDPEKAMDIANYYIISCCKNYGRINCNNSLFKMMNKDFSASLQQELMIAMYNEGPGNTITHIKDKTINQYLKQGPKDNYLNKVLKNTQNIKENNADNFK